MALDELPGHDPDAIAQAGARAAAIFVYHARIDTSLLDRLRTCRVLARCGAGYDNIDVTAARARGIAVTYVPEYGINDVAEHALALLLACARRIAASDRAVQRGGWPSFAELGPPALAAPQSHAGKTSSFMIPPILSTFDRVVATTTKLDMVRATALARAIGEDRRGLAAAYRSPDPGPDPLSAARAAVRLVGTAVSRGETALGVPLAWNRAASGSRPRGCPRRTS